MKKFLLVIGTLLFVLAGMAQPYEIMNSDEVVDEGQTKSCNCSVIEISSYNQIFNFEGSIDCSYPTEFFWNFGDGALDTGQFVQHIYNTTGVFNVTVKAQSVNPTTLDTSISYCSRVAHVSTLKGTIHGQVFIDADWADTGYVVLYHVDSNFTNYFPVDTTYLDSSYIAFPDSGYTYFYFTGVSYGRYLIKTYLSPTSSYFNTCLPTYHSNSLLWGQADEILVQSAINQVTMDMMKKSPNTGPCSIQGQILSSSSKGTALSDVDVYLLSDNDVPYRFLFSDNNGNFNFDSLDYGSYKVYIDIPGMESNPPLIELTAASQNYSGLTLVADSGYIYVLNQPEEKNRVVSNLKVFPNPARDNIYIASDMPLASNSLLKVFDITGQMVINEVLNVNQGTYNYSVDLKSLQPGIYIISLISEGKTKKTGKFVKI